MHMQSLTELIQRAQLRNHKCKLKIKGHWATLEVFQLYSGISD